MHLTVVVIQIPAEAVHLTPTHSRTTHRFSDSAFSFPTAARAPRVHDAPRRTTLHSHLSMIEILGFLFVVAVHLHRCSDYPASVPLLHSPHRERRSSISHDGSRLSTWHLTELMLLKRNSEGIATSDVVTPGSSQSRLSPRIHQRKPCLHQINTPSAHKRSTANVKSSCTKNQRPWPRSLTHSPRSRASPQSSAPILLPSPRLIPGHWFAASRCPRGERTKGFSGGSSSLASGPPHDDHRRGMLQDDSSTDWLTASSPALPVDLGGEPMLHEATRLLIVNSIGSPGSRFAG